MDSRTRMKTSLELKVPDRPPLAFYAIDSDTASKVLGRPTYWRAKAKCQIAYWEGRRDEVAQSLKVDAVELYKKLDIIDAIGVGCVFAGQVPPKSFTPDPPQKIDDSTWEDKQGRIYKYSPITQDITITFDPQTWTRSHKLQDELWDGNLPPIDESRFEVVDTIIEALGKDKFIFGTQGNVPEWLMLGGMERGLMETADRPEEIRQIFESLVDRAIAEDDTYIRTGQDGVILGTDLASTKGPMISPKMYREVFLNGVKRRIANLRNKNQFVIKHACGNNQELLDIFAEMNFHCYQSVQKTAGMDLFEVQKQYGQKFALWGGVSVENLMNGTPEQVRAEVREFMQKAAPQGGVIMGTSHSVAVGTKYENFMALLDEYSKYT